jgi:ferredoxin
MVTKSQVKQKWMEGYDVVFGEDNIRKEEKIFPCIKCGACFNVCPPKVRAVSKTTGEEGRP